MEELLESLRGRKRTLALLITASVCIIALVLAGRGDSSEETTIPDALRGTWRTDNPKMKDRYLKLTESLVIFGQGHKREQVCVVDRVESGKTAEGAIPYTVHYHDDDARKWTLEFGYYPASGGIIRLQHRSELWRREGGEVRI